MRAALLKDISYHHPNKYGVVRVIGRLFKEVVRMKELSVNSLLEDLDRIKDYAEMADLSQKNISRLFSVQLRNLPTE